MEHEPKTTKTPVEIYEAVAARRTQFDNLVWQVPVVSLTGLAFLFTIALSGDSSQLGRAIAAGLAFMASVLSMRLMSRHRQAEIADAHWLRDYEVGLGAAPAHGPAWAERRNTIDAARKRWHRPFSSGSGYDDWMIGFGLFALAAVAIFVINLVSPGSFQP